MAYTAEILAVGTELLLGGIANTDAQMISRGLAELGIVVHHHVVVGDNPERLRGAGQKPGGHPHHHRRHGTHL